MLNKKGFTLIELLVVIAIFALMANITMISLDRAKRESRDTKRMSDINQLRSALQLYSTDKQSYPAGDGVALGVTSRSTLDGRGWAAGPPETPFYMPIVPRDPKMVSQTESPCTDTSSSPCDYGYTLYSADSYVIYFYFEGKLGGMEPGLHWATKDNIY
ncbi:prepilin-type N-terminal cleavage/methylation domain-containing protein [Candidatus Kuenenbacteria bacterium]|nr:prepilin-type N-terminal cleavage/methylation domain-containing protein [Candidatus Kuenenbacteria bacterium]